MAQLEKIGQFFQVRRSQSVLIFSILNHPCSCSVYYYLFGVFLPLVNYDSEDSFNLKAICTSQKWDSFFKLLLA